MKAKDRCARDVPSCGLHRHYPTECDRGTRGVPAKHSLQYHGTAANDDYREHHHETDGNGYFQTGVGTTPPKWRDH